MITLDAALSRLPAVLPVPSSSPAVPPALAAEAVAALAPLLAYWRQVGASERHMVQHPPPLDAFQAAASAADRVCAALVEPQPLVAPAAAAVEAEERSPNWLHAACDLAMCWTGLLAEGAADRTRAAVHCGLAGLAAVALLCASPAGALEFLGRGGAVLLAELLSSPQAPAGWTRRTICECSCCRRKGSTSS